MIFILFAHAENCYASIAPSIACSTSNHPYTQSANCKHQPFSTTAHVAQTLNGIHAPCNAIYANPQLSSSHSHCAANGHGHKFNGVGGGIESNYSVPHTAMPHSKSLEHYHEVPSKAAYHQHPYPARHSFDKPSTNAYDFNGHSYDCLDGPSAGHLNDRYALPVHVESHYAQIAPSGNVYDQMPAPPYAHTYATPYTQPRNNCSCNNDHRLSANVRLATNECHNYHAQLPSSVCEVHGKMYSKNSNGGCGHGFEPYLINFDDKPMNGDRIVADGPNDYRRHHESGSHAKSHYNQYDANSKSSANDKGHPGMPPKYSQRSRHTGNYDDYPQNEYVPHSESKRSSTLKNYARNKKLLGEYEEHFDTNDSRNSRQSDFDSFDSGNNLSIERELSGRGAVDQTTSSKIRDGVGSYETWNYVFQNIGKNGYNKVNECPDADELTMQGLDLNAVPPANEKRRSRILDVNESGSGAGGAANRKIAVDSIATNINGSSNNRKTVSVDVNGMPKSMLKQPNGLRENGRDLHETNDIGKKSNFKMTNGSSNISTMANGNGQTPSTMRNDGQPHIDEIRSAPNEWSCKFCTFLNPVHLRICQMCFKSQDFVIDAPKASTCV